MRVAHGQGAAAWELRAAIELARMETGAAKGLLGPLCATMKDADPIDLAQAAALMREEPPG